MGMSRIILIFIITIAMAMFVALERNKTLEVGYQIAKLQKNYAELEENYKVSRLKKPEIIAMKVQSLKLPLTIQEERTGIILMGQKFKDNVMKATDTNFIKDLYTQKELNLNCCSLHN